MHSGMTQLEVKTARVIFYIAALVGAIYGCCFYRCRKGHLNSVTIQACRLICLGALEWRGSHWLALTAWLYLLVALSLLYFPGSTEERNGSFGFPSLSMLVFRWHGVATH